MPGKVIRIPVAALALVSAALLATNTGAFAYTSGSIGYDISYRQCSAYPSSARLVSSKTFGAPRVASQAATSRSPWWNQPRNGTPPANSVRLWYSQFTWGIVGVDSGFPFMSATHPGNPCLAGEYRATSRPGLYINTGYDPSYTDTNHTTASCITQSGAIAGRPDQQKAWAVGCSEAQDDYAYANGKGITSAEAWWLDVETANSWCSPAPSNCTDLSLNQYTIQGIIDTFNHIGAVPVGIYSNQANWAAILGSPALPVTGATMDWYASGTGTAQQAQTFCTNSYSFSGAPVTIVQFTPNPSTDRDFAC